MAASALRERETVVGEVKIQGKVDEGHAAGAKAYVDFSTRAARLKSCPFKAAIRSEVDWIALLDFEHQAFEIFGLWQVEDHGVIGGGSAALAQSHAPMRIGCG